MNSSLRLLTVPACALVFATSVAFADPLQESITATDKNNRQEQASQRRIDALGEQTRAMLEEYHVLSRELDSLTVYNDQLQRLVQSQLEEQALIRRQMDDIELTQREIVPLMLRMIDSLEDFVTSDMPFLLPERLQRARLLRDLMDRSDVAVAEKYRRVLEAYQIELDYSRTLEAYREEVDLEGGKLTVDFLRLGRIGLYYQTLDGHDAAYWDRAAATWVPLDTGGRLSIRRAMRVANQQAAPELLELPLPGADSHAAH